MSITNVIIVISGFFGSLCFGVLFNIHGKRLLFAALGGFMSSLLFVVFSYYEFSEALNYLIVAFSISVYAEIMARILKTPTTTFITCSLIPLIPGSSLYYTMAEAFKGTYDSFVVKATGTLELAAALALGIIVALMVTKIFIKITKEK